MVEIGPDSARLEAFTRVGWIAKGVVYALFGVAAIAIAADGGGNGGGAAGSSGEASLRGALGTVVRMPGGRILLAALSVGLLLYCGWRLLSVLAESGNDADAWLHRTGYGFSAAVYATLGVTALQRAATGGGDSSSTIETVSRALLENSVGRWVLGAGGIVTIGVGGYFLIEKSIRRGFADDVDGVAGDPGRNSDVDRVIWIAGIVGWFGRGVVTALVGFFVLRAAVTFDASEARGFDRALREAASTAAGTALVAAAAVGLTVYGLFCLMSSSRRSLG